MAERRFIRGALLTVLGAAGFLALARNYSIGLDLQDTTCLEDRVYLIRHGCGEIRRGGAYAFRAEGLEPMIKDGSLLVKTVTGVPGDIVTVTEKSTEVNGVKVSGGPSMAEKFGHKESFFIRSLAVPPGKYFLTGTNGRSLDSRYTGTVREELYEGRAYPLF